MATYFKIFQIKYPRGRYYLKNRELFTFLIEYIWKFFFKRNENYKNNLISYFTRYYNKNFGMTCSSCRMAFNLIISSLKLSANDEILMTPITIPDMINMVILQNLKPVFIDINVKDHAIEINSLINQINNKTKVLLLTHISGISQDMELIKSICTKNNIILIEDISQAHGTTTANNTKLGEFGDFTIASLTVGKSISSFVGGVLLTNNLLFNEIKSEFAKKSEGQNIGFNIIVRRIIEAVKVSFLTNTIIFSYFTYFIIKILNSIKLIDINEIHLNKGHVKKIENDLFLYDLPFRRKKIPLKLYADIYQWQAALGLFMIKCHHTKLAKRRDNSKLFFSLINSEVKNCISLDLNFLENHNYYHIPFYVKNMIQLSEFKKYLFNLGVDTGGYSLSLCSTLSEFAEYNCNLNGASQIYKNCIFIPIDETLTKSDVNKIAEIFNRGVFAIS